MRACTRCCEPARSSIRGPRSRRRWRASAPGSRRGRVHMPVASGPPRRPRRAKRLHDRQRLFAARGGRAQLRLIPSSGEVRELRRAISKRDFSRRHLVAEEIRPASSGDGSLSAGGVLNAPRRNSTPERAWRTARAHAVIGRARRPARSRRAAIVDAAGIPTRYQRVIMIRSCSAAQSMGRSAMASAAS